MCVADDDQVLDVEYSVESDRVILLILESAGGATHGRPARRPRLETAVQAGIGQAPDATALRA